MSIRRAMVHVDKDDKKGRKTISAAAAKKLASYNHALLVEADDAQLSELQKRGYAVEVQEQATIIKLRAVQFDTASGAPAAPAALGLTAVQRSAKRKREFYLVQFVGPVKAEWGKKIGALRARLGDYVPENSFLVEMSTGVAGKVKALPFVNWVGPYEPAYKVSPLLMGQKVRAMGEELAARAIAPELFKPTPEGNLTIQVHAPSDLKKVVKAVKDGGGSIVAAESNTITASMDTAVIEKIAKMVEVKWIEPFERPVLSNNVAAQIMDVQPVWNNHELDGAGEIVAVSDTGLDTGVNDSTMHADFRGRIVAIHDRVNDGAGDVNSGHGTHVAGSVLGNGIQSNGAIRGMAPAAQLVFQAVENNSTGSLSGIPADYNQLFQEAYDDGARIHTNSWGMPSSFGQYTAASEDIDEFMWNHRDSIILFAAGNDGRDSDSDGIVNNDSTAPQATAKNCISVGASESNRPHNSNPPPGYDIPWATGSWATKFPRPPISTDHVSNNPEGMAAFSSRGPADDGRPKPDVVAPGTNILSARSSRASGTLWGLLPAADPNVSFYLWSGGTSMATPLTAGTVALVRQYLRNVCRHTPSGALLKALLIHGAVPMTGQYTPSEVGAVPDNSQGWGRVNLESSLYPAYPSTWQFRDSPADTLATGDQRTYTFNISNTGVPFRATLVWTDFPSSPTAGGGLVNELRLSVVAPNGGTTLGSPANNNVQQAIIANPQAGNYTVQVSGVNIRTVASQSQRQDFALVVSGGLSFVDVYVKDSPADTGIPPSPRPWNQSPDISLVIDRLRRKVSVFVKVHNRGSQAAKKTKVCLYWAKGLNPTPRLWRTDGIRVRGRVGNCQLLDVPARGPHQDGEATTSAFEIVIAGVPIQNLNRLHGYFLIATVSHTGDPIRSGLGRWDNNVAARAL